MKRFQSNTFLFLLACAIPLPSVGQSEANYFDSYYRELEGLPQSVLISDLEYHIEGALRVQAAAPPDLRYKIEAIKKAVFQAMKSELCGASASNKNKRGIASRSVTTALAPVTLDSRKEGEISATLVRIVESDAASYCL